MQPAIRARAMGKEPIQFFKVKGLIRDKYAKIF